MMGRLKRMARRLWQPKTVFLPFALVALPVIRALRPWILIRWGNLISHALGHLALNTELYLCERDRHVNRPAQRYIDLPFFGDPRVANSQLLRMWKRAFRTYPAAPLQALEWVNDVIPGGAAHKMGWSLHNDRDVMNLMAGSPPHISFTPDEEDRGRRFLRSLGIEEGMRYVCLNVRDSGYYGAIGVSNHRHAFRDSSVGNYVLAAETLADRGFFVLRMGRSVAAPLVSSHPRVIDYAFDRLGDDFLDIYLAANCYMCLSNGSGIDAVPTLFRRPVSFVNLCPVESPCSSETYIVYISKNHFNRTTGKPLTLREIVSCNLAWRGSTENYAASNIRLEENSPDEIRDVAVETIERLEGTWPQDPIGEHLQARFRGILPLATQNKGAAMHGEFFIRYSDHFLKANPWWLE